MEAWKCKTMALRGRELGARPLNIVRNTPYQSQGNGLLNIPRTGGTLPYYLGWFKMMCEKKNFELNSRLHCSAYHIVRFTVQ